MYSDVFSLKWFIVISHLHRRPPSLADVEMERRGNGGKGERDNVTHDMTPVITLFTRDAWFLPSMRCRPCFLYICCKPSLHLAKGPLS